MLFSNTQAITSQYFTGFTCTVTEVVTELKAPFVTLLPLNRYSSKNTSAERLYLIGNGKKEMGTQQRVEVNQIVTA